MASRSRIFHSNTAFLDILFLLVLLYVNMFIISFIKMNPAKKDRKVDVKAEYIITVQWPLDFDDDVDVYVEDPQGHLVYFNRREDGLMHLDRDDYGMRNDRIMTPFGTIIEYPENREIVTLRGTAAGEYVINVHMYRRTDTEKPPCPVTVSVEKMNPYVSLVHVRVVILEHNGDEKTICRFILDKDGAVKEVNEMDKRLVMGAARPDVPGGYSTPSPHEDE